MESNRQKPSRSTSRTAITCGGEVKARPFLKWVGGKTQLLQAISDNLPDEFSAGEIDTYVEPFVGGGAIFFHVAQSFPLKRAVISDTNADLILAYRTIQRSVAPLIKELRALEDFYLRLSESDRSEFYYTTRKHFNLKKSVENLEGLCKKSIKRTAQLIFLNKTCFNGLFRVNSSGQFNVAFGKYDQPVICDEPNLLAVAQCLRTAEILKCDFEEVLPVTTANSFVYLDPPYRPLTETANFTSYSANTFTALDQQRLARFCNRLTKRGAKVLMNNSDPANVDESDKFFEATYPDFRIVRVEANRMVNCRADRRGKISELMFTNY